MFANDHNRYARILAICYVQTDLERHQERAAVLLAELDELAPEPGYFFETFCNESRFFQPLNGSRIDAMRNKITYWRSTKAIDKELEAVLLVSLMEAADRVDSTTGVQMAYLKSWSHLSHNTLELRMPERLPHAPLGSGHAARHAPGEEPVATPHRDGADRALSDVVLDRHIATLKIGRESLAAVPQVLDCITHLPTSS